MLEKETNQRTREGTLLIVMPEQAKSTLKCFLLFLSLSPHGTCPVLKHGVSSFWIRNRFRHVAHEIAERRRPADAQVRSRC